MKNKFEFFLLKFLSFIISRLSLKSARRLANVFGFIFFHFIPIRKKVVLKNLQIAFPQLEEKYLIRLAKRAFYNLFTILIEILYIPYLKEDEIKSQVKIKNPEIIENERLKKKGIILTSAHFGNWELLAIASALNLNTHFSVIIKPLRNPYVDNFINHWRTKYGNKIIPMGISVKNIFKELRENNIVALLADQRASLNSIEMEFFNKITHVYDGPAVMSLRTEAPLIFAIAIRQKDYTYLVELTKIEVPDIEDETEKSYLMTKKYISLLEDFIRLYPDHWFWFHDRWKH